ncbi:Ion transport protein-domain-containing protein [Haematococcus lacustris]
MAPDPAVPVIPVFDSLRRLQSIKNLGSPPATRLLHARSRKSESHTPLPSALAIAAPPLLDDGDLSQSTELAHASDLLWGQQLGQAGPIPDPLAPFTAPLDLELPAVPMAHHPSSQSQRCSLDDCSSPSSPNSPATRKVVNGSWAEDLTLSKSHSATFPAAFPGAAPSLPLMDVVPGSVGLHVHAETHQGRAPGADVIGDGWPTLLSQPLSAGPDPAPPFMHMAEPQQAQQQQVQAEQQQELEQLTMGVAAVPLPASTSSQAAISLQAWSEPDPAATTATPPDAGLLRPGPAPRSRPGSAVSTAAAGVAIPTALLLSAGAGTRAARRSSASIEVASVHGMADVQPGPGTAPHTVASMPSKAGGVEAETGAGAGSEGGAAAGVEAGAGLGWGARLSGDPAAAAVLSHASPRKPLVPRLGLASLVRAHEQASTGLLPALNSDRRHAGPALESGRRNSGVPFSSRRLPDVQPATPVNALARTDGIKAADQPPDTNSSRSGIAMWQPPPQLPSGLPLSHAASTTALPDMEVFVAGAGQGLGPSSTSDSGSSPDSSLHRPAQVPAPHHDTSPQYRLLQGSRPGSALRPPPKQVPAAAPEREAGGKAVLQLPPADLPSWLMSQPSSSAAATPTIDAWQVPAPAATIPSKVGLGWAAHEAVPSPSKPAQPDPVPEVLPGGKAGGVEGRPQLSRMDSMRSDGSLASAGDDYEIDGNGRQGRPHHMSAEEAYKMKMRKRNGNIMIEGSGQSFWIFDEDHPVRVWVYDRITTKWYDYVMITLIAWNCLGMAMESPFIEPGSPLALYIYWSDVAFTIVFGLEVLVKSFAFTFNLYIREITNIVDFIIVVVSVLVLALESTVNNAEAATALRVLRAIKPLRMLTRSPGMRIVFKSVLLSISAMGNVSLVCFMFFIIFAILGTQLFMGLMWSCNDTSVANVDECVGSFVDPATNATLTRSWDNAFPNFDNTANSLLVCFITATLNGYTGTMQKAMAAPLNKGEQPQHNQNPGAFFWFLGMVVVCAFVLINLYVGVIFSQFSRIRLMSTTGSAFLTTGQHEWAELSKMVFKLRPGEKVQLPRNWLRRQLFLLTQNNTFELLMLLVVLANALVLAMNNYSMSEQEAAALAKANIVFVGLYAAEAAVKITALGWRLYWKNNWHRFDLLLLALGLLDLVVPALQLNYLRVLRVLRLQGVIRLMRAARSPALVAAASNIRALFVTLLASLPAFGNVGALIALIFFMYAYVGVYLFGTLNWNIGINEHVNFRNFIMACSALLRVATGDNWSNILLDCIPQPQCDPEVAINCGSWAAIPFFATFFLLVPVILLSLFCAVVIETFEKTSDQEEWKLSPEALEEFVTLWSEYDDGSGTIAPRELEELLLKLEPPLGLGSMADNKDVLRFVYDLDIPLVAGRVPFHKTAFELVKRVSQSAIPEGALKEQLDRLAEKFFQGLPHDEAINFSMAVTVGRVQRQWRARMRAAKLRRRKTWRAQRDGAPDYCTLIEEKDAVIERYHALKQS